MTKILAVIDPKDTCHLALERCMQLPPESDLNIHAVLFVEQNSAEHFAKIFKENSEWLHRQVTPYIANGYQISYEVMTSNNLYEAVIDAAQIYDPDFVVKPMRQHSLFATVFRTTTDWNLIRHCPFPLLLVSDQNSTKGKPVLAAIDVYSDDDNHDKLNDVILKQTLRLAKVLGSETHVMSSYRTPIPMAAVGSLDTTPYPTPKDLREYYKKGVSEFLGGKLAVQAHIEEGPAAIAINSVSNRIGAGVVVIGTVARKGVSGVLIGNTAESVLEAATCDVLVVKLPG